VTFFFPEKDEMMTAVAPDLVRLCLFFPLPLQNCVLNFALPSTPFTVFFLDEEQVTFHLPLKGFHVVFLM